MFHCLKAFTLAELDCLNTSVFIRMHKPAARIRRLLNEVGRKEVVGYSLFKPLGPVIQSLLWSYTLHLNIPDCRGVRHTVQADL